MDNILKVNIADREELSHCYIPQFKYGGIFVMGNFDYHLNDEVFLLLSFPSVTDNIALNTKVHWLSKESALAYRQGIGLHFSNDSVGSQVRAKIEAILAEMLPSQNSYTF